MEVFAGIEGILYDTSNDFWRVRVYIHFKFGKRMQTKYKRNVSDFGNMKKMSFKGNVARNNKARVSEKGVKKRKRKRKKDDRFCVHSSKKI